MPGEERVPPCRRSHLLANFDSQNLSLVNVSTLLSPPMYIMRFPISQKFRGQSSPSDLAQAKLALHRSFFYLIRTAGLVQCVVCPGRDRWLLQLELTSVSTTTFTLLLLQFPNGSLLCA